jgi:tRNA(fMet)-specific endonuclease VapC
VTLFILDTDHLSLYQRDVEPLLSKLLSHPPNELAITIVTVEEQLRGRLAQIRKATTAAHLNEGYRWLRETVDQLARLPVLDFDDRAATLYEKLLSQKLRIGTQDLRIASIVLSQNAVIDAQQSGLLTCSGLAARRLDGLI